MEKLVFETSNLPLPFGGSIWMEGKKSERIGKKKCISIMCVWLERRKIRG
jgi:hypothetical protein